MNQPRYAQRRDTARRLMASPNTTEEQWIDFAERWHEGDLADTRYPMVAREMGWFLLIAGDALVGATAKEATTAAHYAGVELALDPSGRGWRVGRDWDHG